MKTEYFPYIYRYKTRKLDSILQKIFNFSILHKKKKPQGEGCDIRSPATLRPLIFPLPQCDPLSRSTMRFRKSACFTTWALTEPSFIRGPREERVITMASISFSLA